MRGEVGLYQVRLKSDSSPYLEVWVIWGGLVLELVKNSCVGFGKKLVFLHLNYVGENI